MVILQLFRCHVVRESGLSTEFKGLSNLARERVTSLPVCYWDVGRR